MKILQIFTKSSELRSEAIGWTGDDTRFVLKDQLLYNHDKIGLVRSHDEDFHTYSCVLLALADDWQLLGPPEKMETGYLWWLVKRC